MPKSAIPTSGAVDKAIRRFQFFKGGDEVFESVLNDEFDWKQAAAKAREQLGDAMNARHLSFLLGSGCSSCIREGIEIGIPTMVPLAREFLVAGVDENNPKYPINNEAAVLKGLLGIDIGNAEYAHNLERLMEVLFSTQFVLKRSNADNLSNCLQVVDSLISKVSAFICDKCSSDQAD